VDFHLFPVEDCWILSPQPLCHFLDLSPLLRTPPSFGFFVSWDFCEAVQGPRWRLPPGLRYWFFSTSIRPLAVSGRLFFPCFLDRSLSLVRLGSQSLMQCRATALDSRFLFFPFWKAVSHPRFPEPGFFSFPPHFRISLFLFFWGT